ncbi:unnamed protein product [Penicillium salamii]|nr:unnamed protein product [Penicillium salamii]CAG8313855.1 unnamed protein product [Penicillium salamii]
MGPGSIQRDNDALSSFWNGALKILESSSTENHQFLAKDLVSDELRGFAFILATAQLDNLPNSDRTFSSNEAFLKVITHTSLLSCLSVDTFVGTLYTYFGGTNGDRAIRYLKGISQKLMAWEEDSTGVTPMISLNTVNLILNVLYQLVSRVRHSRFHDELPRLLDLILAMKSKLTERSSQADLDGISSRIEILTKLVNNANRSLLAPKPQEETRPKSSVAMSSFPMDLHIPGGRHDNDLAEISQIRILPTLSEILSGDTEYLPSTNFLQPHILTDPLQRYIDSTFRLLRHDIFGSAKDVLRDLLQHKDLTQVPHRSGEPNGAHLYLGARIQHIFVNERHELEANLSFHPPPELRKKTPNEQCIWWQGSSRLDQGSLVCLLSSQGTNGKMIFLEVTAKNCSKNRAHQNSSSLVSDKFASSITAKLALCQQSELLLLSSFYSKRVPGILVDFHGMIPATFMPILKNLQRIEREGELSFQQWILPARSNDGAGHTMPPPAYARRTGFVFPLASITKQGVASTALDPRMPESIDILRLEDRTGLDHGQCQALIATLTREYALIQGPPGTGKSYLGVKIVQALLEIKRDAKIGPIMVICYTNHALDQFLKHILEVGIEKIIRIGGRSQADELEGKNLRVVSKNIAKTRVESQTLGMSYAGIDSCMNAAGNCMKPLHHAHKGLSWNVIEPSLRRNWPDIHRQLKQQDEDGYKTTTKDVLLDWLGLKSMKTQEAHVDDDIDEVHLQDLTRAANRDIHSLALSDRRVLANSWFRELQEAGAAKLFEAVDQATSYRRDINAVHEEIDRRALLQADVIGITTTALARHIETLRRVNVKIIICEEAAEVMEAHIISALMPGVEHFIQIGDHRQLRPQIQNHSLSLESSTGKTWQLDRSQFERRAVGEPGLSPAPIAQLNIQRRMRPGISQLIRSVYPRLEDHESVMILPNVVGMRDNLFWLDHRHDEDSRHDGSRVRSHSNQWEVEMATAMVRHLVRQGEYKSAEIALLTPHTGQLRKLRASLSNDFEICLSERDLETLAVDGIESYGAEFAESKKAKTIEKKTLAQTLRLATVDNFQGEEAKVIIVSLVRSNPQRKVGFLRTENRINVLLSRAQHGMYIIGNSETYLNVKMWTDVHSQLAHASAVGTELALCCPRHPQTPILCSEPHDFERKSPAGGCSLLCARRLEPCGHQCQAMCHSALMHDGFSCEKACPRIRSSCRHECPKLCGEDCGPCLTKIHHVELLCGHIKLTIFCHQMSDLESIKCDVQLEKTIPRCGHTVQVSCSKDITSMDFRCPAPCEDLLACGHKCSGSCANCIEDVNGKRGQFKHISCTRICDRPYGICNHRCPQTCHDGEKCRPCDAKCEVQCSHSACDSTCGTACAPCIERCTWSCIHQGSCSMPCAAPCNRLPCDKRCTEALSCGHQCPSLCGEDCPNNLCQTCGDKGDARVDFLEWKTYSEIDLDETPIIVLGCGHFFTSESVDGFIGLDEAYTRDKDGNFDGLQTSSSLASVVPLCPDCKMPIRQYVTKRYNRVFNRAVMDEISKRFLSKGRAELQGLQSRLNDIEEDLGVKGANFLTPNHHSELRSRYATCKRLEAEASTLSKTMRAENQPIRRLMDAISIRQKPLNGDISLLSARMEAMTIASNEPDNLIVQLY